MSIRLNNNYDNVVRNVRVGMFINLTELEAKTKYQQSYTADFYGKPDPVGQLIFSPSYQQLLCVLIALWVISLISMVLSEGRLMFAFPLCLTSILLGANVALLGYRCYKYPPFTGI